MSSELKTLPMFRERARWLEPEIHQKVLVADPPEETVAHHIQLGRRVSCLGHAPPRLAGETLGTHGVYVVEADNG